MRFHYKASYSVVKILAIFALLVIGTALMVAGGTLFVSPEGDGDCSQSNPGELQACLNLASDGDTIYLAEGTYTGTGDEVVNIIKSITLRGGWDRSGTGPVVCDPSVYRTTLDGEGARRVVYISGEISPRIEGLDITRGDATGLGGYEYPAGHTYDAGGGVYVLTATATFLNNRIFDNTALNGGGVFLGECSCLLDKNEISHNTATSTGGGVFIYNGSPLLKGNKIVFNATTKGNGGGGGGVYLFSSDADLVGNEISQNSTASHGGGISVAACAPRLTDNLIIGNVAAYNGGGISFWYSHSLMVNNIIAQNRAPDSRGDGLWIAGSDLSLVHTTIASNGNEEGEGIYVTKANKTISSLSMINTILVGHTVGITVQSGSSAKMDGTLWGRGPWANGVDRKGEGSIIGNVDLVGDPAFLDSDAGDYHLSDRSAAIDMGVSTDIDLDIDGDPRLLGGAPDIGADEFSS